MEEINISSLFIDNGVQGTCKRTEMASGTAQQA